MGAQRQMLSGRSGWLALDAEPPPEPAEPLVIDASAFVKAALADRLSELLAFAPHSPTLMWSEVASALSQLRRRNEITASEAAAALDRLLAHSLTTWPSSGLVARALAIAEQLSWAKTYDAEYLALAERLGARLLTDDARLRATSFKAVAIVGPAELLGE